MNFLNLFKSEPTLKPPTDEQPQPQPQKEFPWFIILLPLLLYWSILFIPLLTPFLPYGIAFAFIHYAFAFIKWLIEIRQKKWKEKYFKLKYDNERRNTRSNTKSSLLD